MLCYLLLELQGDAAAFSTTTTANDRRCLLTSAAFSTTTSSTTSLAQARDGGGWRGPGGREQAQWESLFEGAERRRRGRAGGMGLHIQ